MNNKALSSIGSGEEEKMGGSQSSEAGLESDANRQCFSLTCGSCDCGRQEKSDLKGLQKSKSEGSQRALAYELSEDATTRSFPLRSRLAGMLFCLLPLSTPLSLSHHNNNSNNNAINCDVPRSHILPFRSDPLIVTQTGYSLVRTSLPDPQGRGVHPGRLTALTHCYTDKKQGILKPGQQSFVSRHATPAGSRIDSKAISSGIKSI
jgi:hypothetical protein